MAYLGRDYSAGWRLLTMWAILKLKQGDWRVWLGLTATIISLGWLLSTTNWSDTWTALGSANYWLVLLAFLLNMITIPIRTIRWRLLFPNSPKPGWTQLTAVMLIGQAVNLIAPARAGDIVRSALVGTVKATYVLGTLMIQSAIDLLFLIGLVIWLLFQTALPAWWRESGVALLLTTLIILLSILFLVIFRRQLTRKLTILRERWPRSGLQQLANMASDLLNSLESITQRKTAVWNLAYSCLVWMLYAAVNFTLLAALNLKPSWLAAVFSLVILQLGVAIPSSPGRIGVFHILGAQALAVFKVPEAPAVSFAIILHLISVVLPILLGGILFWRFYALGENGKVL